ncbi:Piwi domain-containing protein [Cubamyces lactineus]|nr:Piwi domain-containing protein [Cubamyces lactineus]
MSTIEVYTNSFEVVELPSAAWFHYDEITPDAVVKRRNYEIMDRVQLENAAVFNPRAVYDGRKNLFCKRDIPSGSYSMTFGRRQSKTFQVLIKRVSVISPNDVRKLTRKRSPHDFSDNAMSLNLLQLIVRQAPNMRHNFPADARSFYIAHNAKDLRNGLSAWRGFFQSVRPVMDRLVINVDVSHAAVYTPGRLVDTMLAHLQLRDVRALTDLSNPQLAQLRLFLKGVRVKATISRMKARPITDLVREAGMQEFDKDKERWTVARHFEQKYNVQVRFPRMVGVRVGQTAIIPAEFLEIVPGQLYRKKIPPACQKDFLQFSTQKPHERLRDIQNAVSGQGQLFDYATSDFMKEAGMKVSTNPMSITGSVIPPPGISYRNEQVRIGYSQGKWNVLGKQFIEPCTLRFWGVAVFDRASDADVKNFLTKLVGNLERAAVANRFPPFLMGNPNNPEPTLIEVGKRSMDPRFASPGEKPHPQLILVILPANAADCRRAVKHWGDIKMRVSTQCVRSPKWLTANDQYCNNVVLKINARLGGTNSVIDSDAAAFLRNGCMVVGADVGHPGPGAAVRPSVTGLVASVDGAVSKLTSYANVQQPRQEIIEDLESMMIGALSDYLAYQRTVTPNPPPPRNVIFYRDGVSEGEFAQVAAREIPLIRSAFVKSNIPEKFMPKLLFVVVGKRHHVRFFPKEYVFRSQADNSGNCPAGLLIDQHITNPNYPDFYLQSHAGLLGTSRPGHYVILENETGLNPRQVQTLTYHLCHTYASATRSVSIPAPRICSRMEFHCEDGAGLSDTASNVTGGNAEVDLDMWKRAFKPTALNKRMYFL